MQVLAAELSIQTEKKQEIFLYFLKVSLTHKKKERTLTTRMKRVNNECNVGGNTYSPKLRLLA